ncbi:MAG: DUF348 domain-containing protein [Candidatus Microsaccharimonas sossegonensis]|uniref:DUF348 domain-containing protein n=1 Tax=Candidatus Microsaccharimonas sossegonensis TaxID=2506948 RepID=A0A4Q0AGF7_9BACT|nr:MAG: DUF348 domain-containing protein [Candidatus Microsaccharimonas sossegonensis]
MVWRFSVILILMTVSFFALGLTRPVQAQASNNRLITVYDRGTKQVFLTNATTIGEALTSKNITLDAHDTVEPSTAQKLLASEYKVNIYRARPVVVVDGATRVKTVSPFQTAEQIAKDVGITVYPEDKTKLTPLTDYVNDGAGLELTILRAKTVNLDVYGNVTAIRTSGNTVGDMLREKGITLGRKDYVSPSIKTPITAGMGVRVWREGIQTITVAQPISFSNRIVYDADQPIGYRAVQTPGILGNRNITYQVEIKNGVEISRVELATIVTRTPIKETDVIGVRNDGAGLTKSKGAQYWTDSKGVSHRETYYDLNMSVVMQACGQGGYYTVRPDGAKVDAQGYIIVAANYGRYPRCSVVETSLGPAKVYDTGGFATRYPTGFDLATDWSNPDGI